MAGVVFKNIKKSVDADDNETYTVIFEFPCASFKDALHTKELIEARGWDDER